MAHPEHVQRIAIHCNVPDCPNSIRATVAQALAQGWYITRDRDGVPNGGICPSCQKRPEVQERM